MIEPFRVVLLKQENPECTTGHSDVTKMEGGHIEITIGGQPQNCTFNQKPEKCDQRSHQRQQFEKVNIDGSWHCIGVALQKLIIINENILSKKTNS